MRINIKDSMVSLIMMTLGHCLEKIKLYNERSQEYLGGIEANRLMGNINSLTELLKQAEQEAMKELDKAHLKEIDKVSNLHILPVVTRHDIPIQRIIDQIPKAEDIEELVVIWYDKNNNEHFASSESGGPNVLWLLERTKHKLLELCDD